jgi:hypothetical protein
MLYYRILIVDERGCLKPFKYWYGKRGKLAWVRKNARVYTNKRIAERTLARIRNTKDFLLADRYAITVSRKG